MKNVLRLALVAVALPCCAAAHRSLVGPEKGGRSWTEVTSPHFDLKTDLDADDAREASRKLEEMFASISELGFASADKPRIRLEVVYFRSHDDYTELAPRLTGGVFIHSGRHDFENHPLVLLGGDLVQTTRETLQHELTHMFVHYYYPQAPTWLNEGLASYMETMRFEGGSVILGRESVYHRFWRGDWRWQGDPFNSGGGTVLIPVSEAPVPSALVAMTADEFYGNRDLDPTTPEGREAARAMAAHYQGAWCLVHMLLTNPSYQEILGDYLGRIHAGERNGAAWEATVGSVAPEKLQQDYRASLAPKEVTVIRAKFEAPAVEETARAMGDAEVHVLWARLRPDTTEGQRAALADLAAARALGSSDDPDLVLTEAAWRAEGKEYREAEGVLRDGLASHADDPRLWDALGLVTLRENLDASGNVSPAAGAALAPIGAKLHPIAKSAAEWDLLARISGIRQQVDAGIVFEKRALAADSSCLPCLGNLAGLLYEKGRIREALEAATLAMGLAPEGRSSRAIVQLAAECRRKLAAGGDALR
jgi:hypothetical protein